MLNEKSQLMIDSILVQGIMNFVFPFSFPEAGWLPAFDEIRDGQSHKTHEKYLNRAIASVIRRFPPFEWGLTWMPLKNWEFVPLPFGQSPIPVDPANDDFKVMQTLDRFYFLADALKKHPFLRIRLKDRWQIKPQDSPPWIDKLSKVKVDVTLFPSLGQGCLCFRCTADNVGIDELICLRQTQFRRGMGILYEMENSSPSPMEFQDVYREYCERRLNVPFVPFSDVRIYGASIELFELKNMQNHIISFYESLKSYKKPIYGLLCCDEAWRSAKLEQVDRGLNEMSFSTRQNSVDYAQEVTFLKVINTNKALNQVITHKSGGVVGDYDTLVRSTARSIANGYNYFEVVTVLIAYMQSIVIAARRCVSKKKPPRRELIRLRKRSFNARIIAPDLLNIFTGMPNTLEHARGLDRQSAKVGDSLNAIESIIDEYRFFDGELISDIFTSAAVSTALASFARNAGLSIDVALRLGAIIFVGVFGLRRVLANRHDYIGMLALLVAIATIIVVLV